MLTDVHAPRPARTGRRDLWLLAGAVGLSAMGDWLALVALALHVHELTGSALAVSALFATTTLPGVALAALWGRIADRVESVRLLALASVGQALVAVALAFTTSLAPILLLAVLLAAGACVSQPAEFALVPAIAGDDERLARANGLVESARSAGLALGPLLAAVAVAAGGTRLALLLDAASFLAIVVAALLIRARRHPVAAGDAGAGSGRRPSSEGARQLWRDDVLRPVVLGATAALLFIAAVMTIGVIYAKDVLRVGDAGYGLLVAAWMIGMVAGGAGAGRVAAPVTAAGTLAALALQGAGIALAAVWLVLPFGLFAFFAGGAGHGLKNALLRTLIQRRVAAAAHGSAWAAYNAGRNTAELLALAGAGLLIAAVGPRVALLVAGVVPVVIALAALQRLHRVQAARRAAPAPQAASDRGSLAVPVAR
jgi:MFS family permease